MQSPGDLMCGILVLLIFRSDVRLRGKGRILLNYLKNDNPRTRYRMGGQKENPGGLFSGKSKEKRWKGEGWGSNVVDWI